MLLHEKVKIGMRYEVRGNPPSGKGAFMGACMNRKDWNSEAIKYGWRKKDFKFLLLDTK